MCIAEIKPHYVTVRSTLAASRAARIAAPPSRPPTSGQEDDPGGDPLNPRPLTAVRLRMTKSQVSLFRLGLTIDRDNRYLPCGDRDYRRDLINKSGRSHRVSSDEEVRADELRAFDQALKGRRDQFPTAAAAAAAVANYV
jgi:hypothetical protein